MMIISERYWIHGQEAADVKGEEKHQHLPIFRFQPKPDYYSVYAADSGI